MKNTKKIIYFLILFLLIGGKVFAASNVDWYERYEYDSEVIQMLIEQKNREQEEENVEPQKDVFDIIIFMGQSNMVGKGDSSQAVKGIDGAGYEMQFNRRRRTLWC